MEKDIFRHHFASACGETPWENFRITFAPFQTEADQDVSLRVGCLQCFYWSKEIIDCLHFFWFLNHFKLKPSLFNVFQSSFSVFVCSTIEKHFQFDGG